VQRNVLVSNAGRAMIADFGVSSIVMTLPMSTTGPNGTPHWIAPEVVQGDSRPSLESDIWSYGCLSYEVGITTLHCEYIS
jgi:serine/threonine protein kinase